jgi:tRNA (cmo5U34)-methyltransferase
MELREKDNLFTQPSSTEKFEFNESVARVFDDMLERSVPMYRECLESTLQWCVRFAREGSQIYDLGCSTGTFLTGLSKRFPAHAGIRLVGVDSSAPMLEKARQKLASSALPWNLIEADLQDDFSLSNASVVVMNYTLQFIPQDQRLQVVSKIFKGLNPDGLLLMIEKVTGDDPEIDQAYTDFHHRFKKTQGYSQLEIARKREALENVLTPRTVGENIHLLQEAGFASAELFFKWNNFAGFVALKQDLLYSKKL